MSSISDNQLMVKIKTILKSVAPPFLQKFILQQSLIKTKLMSAFIWSLANTKYKLLDRESEENSPE